MTETKSNNKVTKRTLFLSIFATILCIAMLVGTTLAWFTDSAANTGNKIQAGNLSIDLLEKQNDEYKSIKNSTTPVFDYDKWEPGYTDVENFAVKNTGNLALKYTLSIVPQGDVGDLANVIDVYYAPKDVDVTDRSLTGLTKLGTLADVINGTSGTLMNDTLNENGDMDYATVVLKMQETAGNEYQGKSIGTTFDVSVNATQYTYEKDSFDDQYDKNATFSTPVATKEELKDELTSNKSNINVTLTGDTSLDSGIIGGSNTKTITINGNGNTLTMGNSFNSTLATKNADTKLVLNNVKLAASRAAAPFDIYDLLFDCDVEMNDVTTNRAVCIDEGRTAALNNVTINETNNTADEYALWIVAGANVTMNNCTINAVSTGSNKNRAIAIKDQYVTNPGLTTLSVSNTKIASQKKAAILVTSTGGANITLDNVDISGVQADSTNAVWNDSDRTSSFSLINVTGGTVIPEP